MELVNLDPSIIHYVHTLFSTDAGAPVSGQLALELMAQPPRPGEPSYPVYTQVGWVICPSRDITSKKHSLVFITSNGISPIVSWKLVIFWGCFPPPLQETQAIRAALVQNVSRALEVLNSLPGVSCQPVEGGAFVFPRLHLPPRAVQQAQVRQTLHHYTQDISCWMVDYINSRGE